MSLKQNELKIIRTFKIDSKIYQGLKNDEERRRFLMARMEDDIKEGLKNLS